MTFADLKAIIDGMDADGLAREVVTYMDADGYVPVNITEDNEGNAFFIAGWDKSGDG